MRQMEEKILECGKVLPGGILKVGSFLNQQIDSVFLKEMGEEIARLYKDCGITKILTALVFLEHIKSLDEVVTFSEECWDGIDHYANMNIDMIPGEKLTAEQCLYAMLVASANEVCNQVAIYTAGSIPAFADMMNERAAQ